MFEANDITDAHLIADANTHNIITKHVTARLGVLERPLLGHAYLSTQGVRVMVILGYP